jgi:hypothetical protein
MHPLVTPLASPLLLPVTALAMWTLTVLLLIPIARFKAGRAGQVTTEDFRFGESEAVPDATRLPNRNFMNLLEVPVLFYLAVVVAILLGQGDAWLLALAWVYVGLRIVHSLIHLRLRHVVVSRLAVFALSNVVVSLMWWTLLLRQLSAA